MLQFKSNKQFRQNLPKNKRTTLIIMETTKPRHLILNLRKAPLMQIAQVDPIQILLAGKHPSPLIIKTTIFLAIGHKNGENNELECVGSEACCA